mgnify:CR=1 FL=1
MPTTNLPTANHFYTQPIPISAGAEIKLLNRLTSDLDVVFPSGLKFDLSSNSDSLTWINEHNDGTTTDKLIIYVSYPTPVLTKHTFNSVSENVDWELTTQGAPVNLVEGVDYEIEYNDAVSSLFWMELGSPFRNQERGEVAGYKVVPIRIDPISISLTTIGIQTLRGTIRSAVCSSSFGISCGGIEGRLNPVMSVATAVSRPWMQPSYANVHGIYHNSDLYWWLMSPTNDSYIFSLIETILRNQGGGGTIPYYSFSHNGQSFRSISRVHFPSNLHLDKDISISFSASGENIVKGASASLSVAITFSASGKNGVKRGSSSLSVAILSVCESNAIKNGSVNDITLSLSTIVQGKTLFQKGTSSISMSLSLTNISATKETPPLGYFQVVGGTEAPSDLTTEPTTRTIHGTNLDSSKIFSRYKSILAGKTFEQVSGSYVGSGSYLELTHKSSFDQDNFVIAGWIDLQVSNTIKALNPNAIYLDWSPYQPSGVTEDGVSIVKTSDFEFRLSGDNSSSAYVPEIIHGDNTIDITNPDSSSTYPNQPNFEALLKNQNAQFYAISVTTQKNDGSAWASGSLLSQQFPHGRKIIRWRVGTDYPAVFTSSNAGNTYYEGGGVREFALSDESTPLGTTNYLRLGDGGLYPYEATQLMLWEGSDWAVSSSVMLEQVASEIRRYGMGADLATYSRNWYGSVNVPTFSGYWRMGDHGGYDASGVRTFNYGGTSQNTPIGTFDNTLGQHLYPNEM